MISKEVFFVVIESLRQQYLHDKEWCEGMVSLFGVDYIPIYNNSELVKGIFAMLHEFFPRGEDGFCDIEHFCYVCDFGKVGEIGDVEELWSVLNPADTN